MSMQLSSAAKKSQKIQLSKIHMIMCTNGSGCIVSNQKWKISHLQKYWHDEHYMIIEAPLRDPADECCTTMGRRKEKEIKLCVFTWNNKG